MADTPELQKRRAVALRYNQEQDSAPKLIAKGRGLLAERIIALAREHHIHIQEDPDLVAVLSTLDLNTEIPEDLYRAVAEVLAFVYRLNQRMPL
ncbi:MAG: EscU/YscU/HrcU family type III secretion system export apparatus switch protein [Candidatus Hydrogenedentes bacterium]|nr:EscU/YscU/HrcU family type III secretion system export apparatus switch protein [Candidatus Hydrogenedentota bacterium]